MLVTRRVSIDLTFHVLLTWSNSVFVGVGLVAKKMCRVSGGKIFHHLVFLQSKQRRNMEKLYVYVKLLGVDWELVSNIFYFHHENWGNDPILSNIFRMR